MAASLSNSRPSGAIRLFERAPSCTIREAFKGERALSGPFCFIVLGSLGQRGRRRRKRLSHGGGVIGHDYGLVRVKGKAGVGLQEDEHEVAI